MININIRPFRANDWDAVAEIYLQGLKTRNATFETRMPGYDAWIGRFHSQLIWVAESDHGAAGWAGLQPVSARKAYEGVAEVTIYVEQGSAGKGIGGALMRHLLDESEKAGIWSLYASIFPENIPSIRLHRANGFREIGYREKIARLDGKWRNTVLFERRSNKVGI